MFNTHDATATIPVTDIATARRFYEGTLGLRVVGTEGPMVVTYASGETRLIVYQSSSAGTNQATAVTWMVGSDVDAIVTSLAAKGVKFEHYNMPDARREGDIHIGATLRMAWFKDPSGNILALIGS